MNIDNENGNVLESDDLAPLLPLMEIRFVWEIMKLSICVIKQLTKREESEMVVSDNCTQQDCPSEASVCLVNGHSL